MKDNMVQELLLRALLSQNPTNTTAAANTQRQTTPNNMPSKRGYLETLLKSLYLNNAQIPQASNIKNVNNMSQGMSQENQNTQPKMQMPQVFQEFINKNPEFFNTRGVLFEYLNSPNMNLDLEELNKIAQITQKIEEEAIKRFCAKNPKFAQFLSNENSKLTNKLENSMQGGFEGELKNSPTFSAQDIDKMSTDEFLKHKDEIDAQILNLIKNS